MCKNNEITELSSTIKIRFIKILLYYRYKVFNLLNEFVSIHSILNSNLEIKKNKKKKGNISILTLDQRTIIR